MARSLRSTPLPITENQLVAIIEASFEKLTKNRLPAEVSKEKSIFVKRFAHGGMSSGHISLKFWRHVLIPELCDRFRLARGLAENRGSEIQ